MRQGHGRGGRGAALVPQEGNRDETGMHRGCGRGMIAVGGV